MRHSGRKITPGRKRPGRRSDVVHDDPHDAIDLELLRLWMGLSRLRERLCDGARTGRSRSPLASKVPRRKAA